MNWRPPPVDCDDLDRIQKIPLAYYLHQHDPVTGLIADKTAEGSPCSITAVGMALATAPVAIERGIADRARIIRRVLRILRTLSGLPQGPGPDASGYKGFYYHFLDMHTGRRVWDCELSTIDTGFLMAGILTSAAYFRRETEDEEAIRTLGDALYRRVDWGWALDGGPTLSHGWKPGSGFLPHRYTGYDESLLLNVLALGSPTHPIPAESYGAWMSTFRWEEVYGHEYLYCGPLFTHQLSHIWIDFREIQDAAMRARGATYDYFENSRKATLVHQRYAIANPNGFAGYGEHCWGTTASNGPGWVTREVDGRPLAFFDYEARGAPFGPDDGTIAPWAAFASLPFAPEVVMPTIRHFEQMDLGPSGPNGYRPTFNPSFAVEGPGPGFWTSPDRFGLDQGPIALMIANYRHEQIWDLMRACPYIIDGLRRAGFRGGWL